MIKRLIDFTFSITALLLLFPILCIVACTIKLTLGRPLLFKQIRSGLHGKSFTLYKFRTMLDSLSEKGELLPDSERMTNFGKFLRSTSLDELPQLWNVLMGDMSLVGPRPLLMEYLERYTPEQARRHEVKPGISGWAQVNGRNALSWEEKFKLDTWYADNCSVWLDIRILLMTIVSVIRREGIAANGVATMPEFIGSAKNVQHMDVSFASNASELNLSSHVKDQAG